MRNTLHLLILMLLVSSCQLLENKEKKAIDICQKAKAQLQTDNIWGQLGLSMSGLTANATWLDYANMLAKEDPNTKLDWTAVKTKDEGIYLVAFADEKGWGHRWEVVIDQQIVKHVNSNEYLCRKYELSRFDPDSNFQIINITADTIKLEKENSFYSTNNPKKIVYVLKASIINKTGKPLTSADITGKLQVIFKDKTIEGAENWESGFKTKISKSSPWQPNTERDFYIKTKGIEQIYLDYEPEYVFFEVNIKAEDPIGFLYDKGIEEYDLKNIWKTLKNHNSKENK